MTIGNATLRGGQTLLHDARMWGQLARWGIVGLVLAIVLTPAVSVFTTTSAHEWRVVGLGALAEAKLAIGYSPDSGQVYEWEEGVQVIEPISLIASDPRIERIRRRLLATIHTKAWLGLWLGLSCVAAFIVTFWLLGRRMARARRIRGAEMTTAEALGRRIIPLYSRIAGSVYPSLLKARPRVAGVPWPKRAETQHTIVSGTTGSGKTVLISDLVAQIRERGERCILYDKMGSYTRAFFDPARDVLMNPLGRPGAALVSLPGSQDAQGFRHDGGRLDPAAEGHGGPLLGHGRAAAVRKRRGRPLEARRDGEPDTRRAPAQNRTHLPGRSHGGHGGAVHRGPREPQDRALGARHADCSPRRARVPARYGRAVLDKGVGGARGRGGLPVPDLARGSAREPQGPHLDLARDRRERAFVPRQGR